MPKFASFQVQKLKLLRSKKSIASPNKEEPKPWLFRVKTIGWRLLGFGRHKDPPVVRELPLTEYLAKQTEDGKNGGQEAPQPVKKDEVAALIPADAKIRPKPAEMHAKPQPTIEQARPEAAEEPIKVEPLRDEPPAQVRSVALDPIPQEPASVGQAIQGPALIEPSASDQPSHAIPESKSLQPDATSHSSIQIPRLAPLPPRNGRQASETRDRAINDRAAKEEERKRKHLAKVAREERAADRKARLMEARRSAVETPLAEAPQKPGKMERTDKTTIRTAGKAPEPNAPPTTASKNVRSMNSERAEEAEYIVSVIKERAALIRGAEEKVEGHIAVADPLLNRWIRRVDCDIRTLKAKIRKRKAKLDESVYRKLQEEDESELKGLMRTKERLKKMLHMLPVWSDKQVGSVIVQADEWAKERALDESAQERWKAEKENGRLGSVLKSLARRLWEMVEKI